LTLEHAPPESQGGRGIVLTCEPCNTGAGHRVEGAVADRDRALDAVPYLTGTPTGAPVPGKATIAGITLNVLINNTADAVGLIVEPGLNDPKMVDVYFDKLESLSAEGDEPPQIRVSVRRGFHGGRALVGDLKSAYLAAFATFGYAFALQHGMDVVRQQILDPDSNLIAVWWLGTKIRGWATPWIRITDTPMRCVAVGLRRSAVLLPFGTPAEEFYEQLERVTGEFDHVPVVGLEVPWPTELEMRLDHAEGAWSR
jgi:hypothetical protein